MTDAAYADTDEEDPNQIHPEDGATDPDFDLPQQVGEGERDEGQHKKLFAFINSDNICEFINDDDLGAIGQKVKTEYDVDIQSRRPWVEKTEKAMDLAMQIAETKQYPWPRASNVIYPLMTTAAIQFAARAYPAIVQGRNVVKGMTVGPDDGVPMTNPQTGQPVVDPNTGGPAWMVVPGYKQMVASKIGEHMSWQLLDEQPEWEEETDKLLHILPIAGCAFRKTYYDPVDQRNVSVLVSAMRIVINYWAKSIETTPRITEEILYYPLEIEEMERAEIFRHIDYGPVTDTIDQNKRSTSISSQDMDAPHTFLEQHRWLDLDDDGYPEPYIVTVHRTTSQVVRIVARYDHDSIQFSKRTGDIVKIDPIQYYTKYDFLPNPEGAIYGVGFGQLLRPVNEATNTTLNMMIDAGHLQVVGGGFIGKGLSMHTGAVRFVPGEWKAVNATGGTIKDNMVPLVTPGPSTVLFQLLELLIEAGKEISAVKDVLTGEQKDSNIPATTTIALIEQGLKTFTAIYKRVHRSLKKELLKLYHLNSKHLPEEGAGYRMANEWRSISRRDYMAGNGVEPISDPSMVTDMQKMARAQFLLGFANDPLCNGLEIRRRAFTEAQIEKVDDLIVKQMPPNPEMLAKATELETREKRTQAEMARDYAQAILYLAQASQVVGATHLAWVEQQLEIFKSKVDAASAGTEKTTSETTDEGTKQSSSKSAPVEPAEAPPHLENVLSIPSHLSPGPQAGGMGSPAGGQGNLPGTPPGGGGPGQGG